MPAIPPKPPAPELEGTILRSVMSVVNRLPYARVWRNNVGMLKDARGIGVMYGLARGSADLIGIVDGQFLAIEVKRKGGRVTEDQVEWGRVVTSLGGHYAIVYSADEALAMVETIHARRPR